MEDLRIKWKFEETEEDDDGFEDGWEDEIYE